MKPAYFPTTLRARGITAVSREDGRWTVTGRGPRRVITHDELNQVLNARPSKKKPHAGKQPRQ